MWSKNLIAWQVCQSFILLASYKFDYIMNFMVKLFSAKLWEMLQLCIMWR